MTVPLKYFITGASGLLGTAILRYLKENTNSEVYALTHAHALQEANPSIHTVRCDLEQDDEIWKVLDHIRPDVVIHAAGLTNVDACEINPEKAYLLNTQVPGKIARWCQSNKVKLVFISSDHLTDGKTMYFSEEDTLSPLNVYAHTKVEAEKLVMSECEESLIIRTNFFCRGSEWRSSLTDWLWSKAKKNDNITAFSDSFFSPIAGPFLAKYIHDLVQLKMTGVFNVSGRERISKYDFALMFIDLFGFDKNIVMPISVNEANLFAPRPMDMSMSVDKVQAVLGCRMPTVEDSLLKIKGDYINE